MKDLKWIMIFVVILGLLTPFPTQVAPSVELAFADNENKPIIGIRCSYWFNEYPGSDVANRDITTGVSGTASFSRQFVWKNSLHRLTLLLFSHMFMHGYSEPYASIIVNIPQNYSFDAKINKLFVVDQSGSVISPGSIFTKFKDNRGNKYTLSWDKEYSTTELTIIIKEPLENKHSKYILFFEKNKKQKS